MLFLSPFYDFGNKLQFSPTLGHLCPTARYGGRQTLQELGTTESLGRLNEAAFVTQLGSSDRLQMGQALDHHQQAERPQARSDPAGTSEGLGGR